MARAVWLIFDAVVRHVSDTGAAIVFLALPTLVLVAGCIALSGAWHGDNQLKNDTLSMLSIARRNTAVGVIASAALVAIVVLAITVAHMVIG